MTDLWRWWFPGSRVWRARLRGAAMNAAEAWRPARRAYVMHARSYEMWERRRLSDGRWSWYRVRAAGAKLEAA